jgi:hypothetical protein
MESILPETCRIGTYGIEKKSIFGSRLALRNRLNVIDAKPFGGSKAKLF